MTTREDVRNELVALLDWIDEYHYDDVPKTELRRQLAPMIDRLDETAGEIVFYNREDELG